jgi:hypothetical protein
MPAALPPITFRLPGSTRYLALVGDALLEYAGRAGMPQGAALQLEMAVLDVCLPELEAAAPEGDGPEGAVVLRVSIEPGADRLTVRIDGVRAWAPAPVGPGMPDPRTEETAVRCLVDELESLPREDGRRVLRLTKRF